MISDCSRWSTPQTEGGFSSTEQIIPSQLTRPHIGGALVGSCPPTVDGKACYPDRANQPHLNHLKRTYSRALQLLGLDGQNSWEIKLYRSIFDSSIY
jgi:hypothetical protein